MNDKFQLQGGMEREVLGNLEGFKYSESIKEKADRVIEDANRSFQQRFIDVFDFLLAAKSEEVALENDIEQRLEKLERLCSAQTDMEVEDLIDQDLDIGQTYDFYKDDLWILEDGGSGYQLHDSDKKYPLPTFRELIRELTPEKRLEIMKKKSQGFDGLVVTPFGRPLVDSLVEMESLLKNNIINTTSGWRVSAKSKNVDIGERVQDINIKYPFDFDDEGMPSQYMKKNTLLAFEEKYKNFPGWNIGLVENFIDLPRLGKGKTINGRAQIEANQSAQDVIKKIQSEGQYNGETFFCLEDWIALARYNILVHNLILDDIAGDGSGTILIGSYLPDYPPAVLAVEFDHVSSVVKINCTHPRLPEPEYGFRTIYKIL